MAFPTVSRHVRKIFRYPQTDEMPFLRPWQFPLFPDTHTDPSVQPPVEIIDWILHACDSVVVHPPSDIDLYLFQTRSNALAASTGRVFAQMVFELLHRLRMNADIYPSAVLPQREAEILSVC